MQLSRIAVLANELGGVDKAADLLDVDEDILQTALEGGRLSRSAKDDIEMAYLLYARDEDLQDEWGLDRFYIEDLADTIDDEMSRFNSVETREAARLAYAENRLSKEYIVDINTIANARGVYLFSELNLHQEIMITEWLQQGNNLDEPLQAYLDDKAHGGSIWTNIEESDFWEWFRDTFYAE